ncbi:MAG: prepilin-type N-terminal cleavage/methylation domain-containing protein [Armatimonadota bacterium]|nr:MAG: prepilin-type N-terminal cleavage/methylation domain-containing protein [Armatimonadota bacterium]
MRSVEARRKAARAALPPDGFTVIELAVCIVVVLTLAALILAAVNRARGKARQSACASNLHQIVTALAMYAEDHGGKGWFGASEWGYEFYPSSRPGVVEALAPYIPSKGVWFCPSDPWAGKNLVSGTPWVYHARMSYAVTFNAIYILEDVENEMAFDAVTRGRHMWHFGGYNIAYGDGRVKWQKGDPNGPPIGVDPWPP